jgi:transaldolase
MPRIKKTGCWQSGLINGFHTQILAANLRYAGHVAKAALAGADCATLPLQVFLDI